MDNVSPQPVPYSPASPDHIMVSPETPASPNYCPNYQEYPWFPTNSRGLIETQKNSAEIIEIENEAPKTEPEVIVPKVRTGSWIIKRTQRYVIHEPMSLMSLKGPTIKLI